MGDQPSFLYTNERRPPTIVASALHYSVEFEDTFNVVVFKFIFERRLMSHRDQNDIMDTKKAICGGCKHKSCHQALARIQYTAEYARLAHRLPIGFVGIDRSESSIGLQDV